MINEIQTLKTLLMDTGIENSECPDKTAKYVFCRDFPLSGANYLNDENVTETLFVDLLMPILEEKNPNMWFEKRVNLWEFVDRKDSVANYIRKYRHPLQPDIDLLYGSIVDDKPQSPMTGVEIKLFSRFSGSLKAKIPKTTSYEGFYAGLDEAISLLTMGLDFVYLWHVQACPLESFVQSKMKYGDNFFKKNVDENYYITKLGSQYISTVIERLKLPIGYINTYLLFDEKGFSLQIDDRFNVEPVFNPIWSDVGIPINEKPSLNARSLLLNGLGIEDIKIKTTWFGCLDCKAVFHSRFNYVFCPSCGKKMRSVTL